jgi:flagellar operon protein
VSEVAQNISSVGRINAERLKQIQTPQSYVGVTKFDEILQKEQTQLSQEVKFSAHAQVRMQERNIAMTAEDSAKLNTAVERIAEKGGQESLVLMDDLAFVVNVPNRTVITAMDSVSLHDNVFTNIDSAIIV